MRALRRAVHYSGCPVSYCCEPPGEQHTNLGGLCEQYLDLGDFCQSRWFEACDCPAWQAWICHVSWRKLPLGLQFHSYSQNNHAKFKLVCCWKHSSGHERFSDNTFHCNLPLYLSEEIERIQRRALRMIFPDCSYSEGLVKAGLPTLYDRRSTLC